MTRELHLDAYRPDIDGLRAVAILSVLVYHAFPQWLPGGFIGVDIFFVISGFLISNIIFTQVAQGTFTFTNFYTRRIIRIFPALLAVLLACFVFGWFELMPEDYKSLGWHMFAGAGFWSNFANYFESGYFDGGAEKRILLHLWSLAVEEQFYMLWPVLILLAARLKLPMKHVMWVIIALSFGVNVLTVHSNASLAFYSPLTRFWELMAGALLAHAYLKTAELSSKYQNAMSVLGTGFIVASLALINYHRAFPGWWAVLPILGAFLLIAAGPQAWVNRAVLSNRLMVGIGLISYPLYLWHWPLLSFLFITDFESANTSHRLVALALAFLLALVTYLWIEKPLRFGQYLKNKKPVVAVALFIAMAVVAVLGYKTYDRGGLSFRIPQALQSLVNYNYDYQTNTNYECLSYHDQPASYPDACFGNETAQKADKKPVLIWGDSYAWTLFYGINKLGTELDVAQLTMSACPPLLDVSFFDGTSHCKANNAMILARVQQKKYERVVLAANWDSLEGNHGSFIAQLEQTINALQQAGVQDVYLVGPPPLWERGLWSTVISVARQDGREHRIPKRVLIGVKQNKALDLALQALASKHGLQYASLLTIFCNDAEGCLTKVADKPDSLVIYDYGHLSRTGSEFAASHFPKELFKAK